MIEDLGAGVAALCSHLVDLRLCNVSPLLGLLQLMLQLAHLAQICVGLLLLEKNNGYKHWQMAIWHT